MGAGASAEAGSGDTLVIEIGADGEAIGRGCSLEAAKKIFVVIDPRSGRTVSEVKCLNDPKLLRKMLTSGTAQSDSQLKIFVLVPSTTSSKANLMNAHMAAMMMLHWKNQGQNPSFIRLDDYFHNGDAIMQKMFEEGKVVYPAEETESMMGFFMKMAEFLWPKRAYVHWAVGAGVEEGECAADAIIEEMGPLLMTPELALERFGEGAPPSDGIATGAVLASGFKPMFLTFSDDSRDKFQGLLRDDHPDAFCDEGIPEVWTELYPVLLAGPGDLAGIDRNMQTGELIHFLINHRTENPCQPICVIINDESLDAHKKNLWLIPALHQFIENADMVIFTAGDDEMKAAANFFKKAKFPAADVAKTAMFQLIPFPRLHFYTLGTALGAELEDQEIFLPAVTVGPAGGTASLPDAAKFRLQNNPFIFPDMPHERVIPGAEDFEGTSLIMPGKLLCSLIKGCVDALHEKCATGEVDDEGEPMYQLSWEKAFGKDFGRDAMELIEAESNVLDFTMEIQQYQDCSAVEEEEDCCEEE